MSYESQREEQRHYEADVYYEVWRNGGDPDRINPDRVSDAYYYSLEINQAAKRELDAQRPQHTEEPQEELE